VSQLRVGKHAGCSTARDLSPISDVRASLSSSPHLPRHPRRGGHSWSIIIAQCLLSNLEEVQMEDLADVIADLVTVEEAPRTELECGVFVCS
jgi:hypothetical protein